jgi:hypothetical protein
MVVDVAFKLSMFNLLKVDNEFKLLKMVVDVAFKLSMFNLLKVDNEFKLLKWLWMLHLNYQCLIY